MFILTDGKNYVMENPMKQGTYISTTSSIQAKEFTWKQARALLQNRKKSMSWIKKFYIVDKDTGDVEKTSINYKGNKDAYIGKKDVKFDESMIDRIYQETNFIINLNGWSLSDIKTYKEELVSWMSKYDSAESDIGHALQKYREDNDGKNAQAHKMAKIGYLFSDIREKRKHVKQCINYIEVMEVAIQKGYSIEKIKNRLIEAKNKEYKGRTEYYQIALDLLN